jgi:hypothetical protein
MSNKIFLAIVTAIMLAVLLPHRSRKKDAPLRNRLTKKAPYKGGRRVAPSAFVAPLQRVGIFRLIGRVILCNPSIFIVN